MGFGPTTFSLARRRSTAELLPPTLYGAEAQNRTGDTLIFSQVLYHLSYLGSQIYCTGVSYYRQGIYTHTVSI